MTSNKRYGLIAAGVAVLLLVVATIAIGMLDTRAKTTPEEAVERFYVSWIDALKDGSEGPIERGLHVKSTYVTPDFSRYVTTSHEKGLDAVLCTGATPTRFTTEEATIGKSGKEASVTFQADGIRGLVILIRDEQDWWRIDEVDCPLVEDTTDIQTEEN